VLAAVREKKLTQDVGGNLGTRECGDWITKRISDSVGKPDNQP